MYLITNYYNKNYILDLITIYQGNNKICIFYKMAEANALKYPLYVFNDIFITYLNITYYKNIKIIKNQYNN